MSALAWTRRLVPFWPYVLCVLFIALNLAVLLWYQHALHGDFPFEDEWGYVDRLQRLPSMGFWHYVFDRHIGYHLPVLMFFWYLFYVFTHLNIESIRYTGAVILSLDAVLLCVMLRRHLPKMSPLAWLVILYAPFAVCSLNHWATYDQSIESVIQPWQFGMVLVCCWMAGRMVQGGDGLRWAVLCVIPALIGLETYGAGLSILPAAMAAYLVVKRRVDRTAIFLAIAGLTFIVLYVLISEGLSQGEQPLSLGLDSVLYSLRVWVGLTGDAVFSPDPGSPERMMYIAGATILAVQIFGFVHVAFLPAERRKAFMVPLMLTVYNFLVFLEILVTRFHIDRLESTPRYSILMLAGPVSVLFYLILLERRDRLRVALATLVLATLVIGTASADDQVYHVLPYIQKSFLSQRRELIGMTKDPDERQARALILTPRLARQIYPGRLFLEQQHLAMYRGADTLLGGHLEIKGFGPASISAGRPFNLQKDGESTLWIKLNRGLWGDAQVVFGGSPLQTAIHGDLITASVPLALVARPGSYPLYVIETVGTQRSQTDQVEVTVY